MARFRKGTTDHDADGKMGGSRKKAVKLSLSVEFPRAYANGRHARRSGLAKDQHPALEGEELKAWHEGFDA